MQNMSVRTRLLILIVLPLAMLIMLALYAWYELADINHDTSNLYHGTVKPKQAIKDVSDDFGIRQLQVVLGYMAGNMSAADARVTLERVQQRADSVWTAFVKTELSPEERNLVTQIEQLKPQAVSSINQVLTTNPQLADFLTTLESHFYPMLRLLDTLSDVQSEEAEAFMQEVAADFSRITWVFVLVTLLLAMVLAGIGFLIYRSIKQPLQLLQQCMNRVGVDLNLTEDAIVVGQNEIADTSIAFNKMLAQVRDLINNLQKELGQMAVASEEMSANSQQVNSAARSQELQVSSAATAITEMSAAIQEIANGAVASSGLAQDIDQRAKEGCHTMQSSNRAMQQLVTTLQQSQTEIVNLSNESEKISQVLEVIRNIAEQTNLLALNAAIEAARAGDAGRGFAVVADEVRGLATSTQKATENIRVMIEGLQTSSKSVVAIVTDSRNHAEQSAELIDRANSDLAEIQSLIAQVNDMNTQISTATEEQSVVAEDINKNITIVMDGITELTSCADQSYTASEMMAQLTVRVQKQAAAFKV